MREILIVYLKTHPKILQYCWKMAHTLLSIAGFFIPVHKKTMLFASFGGREFNDSPKAIYEEVCQSEKFKDWQLIWAFVDPEKHKIPRGSKVRMDSIHFWKTLLTSKVWISNSGMDRGIGIRKKGIIKVETWHGCPLKKIGGDENQNSLGGRKAGGKKKRKVSYTIHCAQSEYDRAIFERIWNTDREAILLCDLPRNDALLKYTDRDIVEIRSRLDIPASKKVILYTPTYREYLIDKNHGTYIAPPIDLGKWERMLGDKYVFLIRAHYAVTNSLNIKENRFVRDVSAWPDLNDLYAVADLMISDYSSTFIDYSILERPMFCFAYDLEEYKIKRGLYVDLEEMLPCSVDRDEDTLLEHILNMDEGAYCERTKLFHQKYAPYAGKASKAVVDEIERRLTMSVSDSD